jgi:hypothetical protein
MVLQDFSNAFLWWHFFALLGTEIPILELFPSGSLKNIVLRHCFVFEGLLCPSVRREENYQAKACSFSFAKSRVRWQSD